MTSCETALLPLFLAKKFHPDLFKEWDIIREMRKFYAEIYGIDLADGDAGENPGWPAAPLNSSPDLMKSRSLGLPEDSTWNVPYVKTVVA